MSSGPAPFEKSRRVCPLCTTGIENCGTGITTVGTSRVGMGLREKKVREKKFFNNSAWADEVKIVSPSLSFKPITFFLK